MLYTDFYWPFSCLDFTCIGSQQETNPKKPHYALRATRGQARIQTIFKIKMTNDKQESKYDLEERTTIFAEELVKFLRALPKDPINNRICGQLTGSGGSIGANYREANDALGKKDFIHRLKISRKEAKETIHWLRMLLAANPDKEDEINHFVQEAEELKNILSSIIQKV